MIVSQTKKSVAFFKETLNSFSCKTVAVSSGAQARRMLCERYFDLVIVNAPLGDESGENLSRSIAASGNTQVILVVKNEYCDMISEAVENCGVITISKPINQSIFLTALKFVRVVEYKLKYVQSENSRLLQKIEDIKIIDRAKCVLVSLLDMNEEQAHKYIEKQAMDKRISRRAVSEEILRTYDS